MEQLEQFDRTDPKNLGRSLYFSLDKWIEAVEMLIRSDEILMAIEVLAKVPSWHREDPASQKKLHEIKTTLFRQAYDSMEYANDPDEAGYTRAEAERQFFSSYAFPRGEILLEEVNKLNRDGKTPWVFELSTSHGLLPLGLAKANCKFNFCAKNLNQAALVKVKDWLGPEIWQEKPKQGQPTLFINTECLEHAAREEDIEHNYYKLGIDFDTILLSVPYGVLGGGLPDWRTRRLGHIRTYTKQDFLNLAHRFFPNRQWEMCVSHSLVVIGRKMVQSSS